MTTRLRKSDLPVRRVAYGFVFASCCFLGAVVVYFFLCESQGRTLEEIDTMYVLGIKPWESKKWQPDDEDLQKTDEIYRKQTDQDEEPETERREVVSDGSNAA